MKIDRINYQKTFNLGNYTSERIGLEAQLEEGDDADFQLANLKKAVEDLHKASNPGLYIEFDSELHAPPQTATTKGIVPTSVQPFFANHPLPSIDRRAIEQLEISIDNAQSIEELQKHKEEAGRLGLITEYINKFNQLNNKP